MKHQISQGLARSRGDTDELAARLAPLEEKGTSANLVTQEDGAIVVGHHRLTAPEEVTEVTKPEGILGLEPVVLVILVLMVAFILFIAWQVSRMPLE